MFLKHRLKTGTFSAFHLPEVNDLFSNIPKSSLTYYAMHT